MNTSHSRALHPITHGWVSSGSTGARNCGEFASDAEITDIIAANPDSMLALEMPQLTPEAVRAGHSLADALPAAVARLTELKQSGGLRPVSQVVAPYRITRLGGPPALGLFCCVDTEHITSSADEPGMVIRTEQVFSAKVRELITVTEKLGALASAVLLMRTGDDSSLHDFLAEFIDRSGEPAVSDADQHGQVHELWLVGEGPEQDRLLDLAGGNELIVADGNHRTLAAKLGGLKRFLAVVTTSKSVRIAAYNRLVRELGALSVDGVIAKLRDNGALITPAAIPSPPERPGTVLLYGEGRAFHVKFSGAVEGADLELDAGLDVDLMDHWCLERELFNRVLGLDAADERIAYVGGDYPPAWLLGEVDAGRAALATLLAPVSVEQFIAVNRSRRHLPRKSTWFTPKARAGLLFTDIETNVGANQSLLASDVALSGGPQSSVRTAAPEQ